MPAIRSLDQVARKWNEVTPLRADEYKTGVENPKKDWATEAIAANDVYKTAVTAAATQGRYGAGVKNAGTRKWQDNSSTKGPSRFSEGVLLAKDAYEDGFSPYHDEIAKVELPPRGAKGDPANINRVSTITRALHEKKLAMLK